MFNKAQIFSIHTDEDIKKSIIHNQNNSNNDVNICD